MSGTVAWDLEGTGSGEEETTTPLSQAQILLSVLSLVPVPSACQTLCLTAAQLLSN